MPTGGFNPANLPPIQPSTPPPVRTQAAPAGSKSSSQAAKGNNNIVLIVLGAVIVVLVCVVLFLLFGDKDGKTNNDTSTPAGGQAGTGTVTTEPSSDPWTDGVEPADPSQGQVAEASDSQVVLRNVPENATLTVDGNPVSFTAVGEDVVVSRDSLPDVCVIRAIVPTEDGYQTAAVWYNYRYGNDLTLGDPDQYGAYTDCDETGLCEPSYKVVDVLTWAYYTGYLNCINNQTMAYMAYSTQNNNDLQMEHVYSEDNAKNEYDLDNYQAVCSAPTIEYASGMVRYNATFVTYATNRETGLQKEISNHRTIELVWQNGMWMVNRMAFLSDEDFNAGRYATLP